MRQSLAEPFMTEVTPLLRAEAPGASTTGLEDVRRKYKQAYIAIKIPQDPASLKHSASYRSIKAIAQVLTLFLVSAALVYAVVKIYLPPLDDKQRSGLHLPRSFEDLQKLNELLGAYMESNFPSVMIVFVVVYIFLNTFSIPGSMWLSVLGGALFGLWIALITVCICSSIGATNCYLLSRRFGKPLVRQRLAARLDQWSASLQAHSHNLFSYMIVLRIAPFPPNWFSNIAAPHVGVPLATFFFGTLFGVAGPSLLHVQAGLTIEKLTSPSEFHIFSWANVGALALIAIAVMVPVWFRRRVESNTDNIVETGDEPDPHADNGDEGSEDVDGRARQPLMTGAPQQLPVSR